MTEKKELFADGIGKIHFAAGQVRFDFVSIQPENEGAFNPVVRIVMPPQGFLGAFNSMQQLIDRLIEAGILKKDEPAAAPEQKPVPEKKSAAAQKPQQKNKKSKKNKKK